jgi:choline dehydrogenase-like flavoprotein
MPTPSGRSPHLRADVVVVGTGAGGSIVAHELAERGQDVLMVERGRYVPPSEFTEDEAQQYARLYSDGALQLSKDFSFQVLQGMCVGGSTVVNNGVCFELPDEVLAKWNGPELDAGLDPQRLGGSFGVVRGLIGAEVQRNPLTENPIVARLGGAPVEPVTANLHECVGCGYCNIGCAFNRKLSMLVHLLPETQADATRRREQDPEFRGRLRILPGCEVTQIRRQGRLALGVRGALRLPDGSSRRSVKIDADRVVLAAGAIHSSRVLMASGIGGKLVGGGLSANLGSHMTAYWEDGKPLDAFAGLQMSHYLDDGDQGHMIETWFNPVMSQALVMPGWLDEHQMNMERYARLGCLGVLVGSTRDGNRVLRRRDPLSGAEIAFTPSTADLRRLLAGLRHAGTLLLEQAKADCVMPATFRYREFTDPKELADLEINRFVKDASDISVNTGHPQGGNAISRGPARGVVDETLTVHGFENLHVCDASVFPTAITVNPQLTVMALAHYGTAYMR